MFLDDKDWGKKPVAHAFNTTVDMADSIRRIAKKYKLNVAEVCRQALQQAYDREFPPRAKKAK